MIKLNKSNGFTLIEMLVALAIAGTILLAFFKIIDSTNRMNVKNDRDIKALNLAQSEIENLRNQIKNYSQTENLYIEDINNIEDIMTNKIGFQFDNISKKISITSDKIPTQQYYKTNDSIDYDLVYKKVIEGKEFEIYLDISKTQVKTQYDNIDTGMYLYTINIKVKSLDEYFSKKETKIQDVKVLSKKNS